jgi:cysteine desulfurase / selenocysteine lyase
MPAHSSEHFDPLRLRAEFPILETRNDGRPLVYLDNGATTQKPRAVIDAISRFYQSQNANIHRGVYHLSQMATEIYDQARTSVQEFLHARESSEIIFTRGTTEGINLVAASWGRANLSAGDEIIVSEMEHHANIVPWQMIAEQTGAILRVIPINNAGELVMEAYQKLLSPKTKIVAITHLSNSLGTINDVIEITQLAHAIGAKVLIDGAQWVAHHKTDVEKIGCDFYVFSGHKIFGPTGIGVLYGRREILEAMPPYQGGGDMIENVTFAKTTYGSIPARFEAGTPNIAGAIGLGAAIKFVRQLDFSYAGHEAELLKYATERLSKIPSLRIVGTAAKKGGVISFVMQGVSSLDIGLKLDAMNIAVRTGHHCCQPVMERMKISGTARASLAMYNIKEEVDALADGLRKISGSIRPASHAQPAAEVEWPTAAASSPQAAADELAEEFELFEDKTEKNQYVLDLGDRLQKNFESLKKITPRVPGCMAEVYLYGRSAPRDPERFEFIADANADIVRGLIAILQKIYSGQRISEVLAFDIEGFFHRIGLDQFITSQRRNGLAGMIQAIRRQAGALAKTPVTEAR